MVGLARGEIQSREIVEDCLVRIEADRDLNAILWADGDRVRAMLAARASPSGPLGGMPVALKDNIDVAGVPTTAGSLVDRDRIPDADAPVWARLRDQAGAVLIAKTHLCEFAYRAHHPALGWVRNPRDRDRATGGSSSGSAAAVGAGLVPAALGTDTGGSLRIPAAYCGVVGLKGTFGAVSTAGVVPLSPSMDHVGVMARSVTDAALVLQEMAAEMAQGMAQNAAGRGRPRRVAGELEIRPPLPAALRVGVEQGYFLSRAQPAVIAAWTRAALALEAAGCRMVPVRLAAAGRWRAAHRTVLLHEAWEYHAGRILAGAPYGPVFKLAISRGARIPRHRYEAALATRARAAREVAAVFRDIDVFLTPTCPTVAPAQEEGRTRLDYTRYTTLASFVGVPAISIPAGTGYLGLPVGVQLISGAGQERKLIGAAALLEGLLATA